MITTITGENDFQRDHALDEVVIDFLQSHEAMAIERLDGEEVSLERMNESLAGISLFAEDKLVILRSPSGQKSFVEQAETIFENVPETTHLVLLEPKLDKRTSYYKYLKTNTKFIQCDTPDNRQLSRWVTEVTEQLGGQITRSDAQHLVDRIGPDQQLLNGEIQKLLAYDPTITRTSINELTDLSPQGSVFELLDAAFAGQTQKAMALYHDQRQQKMEPLAIVGMLAWQMHVIALVQAGQQQDDTTIAKEGGINPFVVRKSRVVARRLSRSQVMQLVQRLLQMDVDLKSKTLNADDVVSQFILELSQTATS